ncbi:MAG: PASTA domain-containing protein, partial [Vulcanimicrobiaceae bacterium]
MVPTIVGQTEADAIALGQTLHLKMVVVSRSLSEQYPRDVVMEQQPAPGTRVREGRQVSLIVSRGVNVYTMPDLRFLSLRDAGVELSRLRLNLGKTKMVSNDDVP